VTVAQVLDYSAGFPGALNIVRAGYVGAVRYIGFADRRKCTTRSEFEDFSRNGLGMALVYEDNTNDWRGGELHGVAAGQRGRDHANAIGFPADRPIYMAVDQDVVTAAEFNLMLNYLRGAAKTLGGTYVTGVYGEADVIDRARDAGVAAWFWQTAAWSNKRRTAAHLLQLIGTVNVGGIGCDINDVLQPDWGQHNAGGDVSTQDVKSYFEDTTFDSVDRRSWRQAAEEAAKRAIWTDDRTARMEAKLDALAGALTDDEANIVAAVRGQTRDAVDVADLSARLTASLGPAIATELGRRLLEGNPA
jgi:Domain of unknown function (DUF1906)